MYLINEISNRDLALLYSYRILRQPSDFLSAIYDAGEPVSTEIFEGTASDFKDKDDTPLYAFSLDIDIPEGTIPYLEFSVTNDYDRKRLETLLFLDNNVIYGKSSAFREPIQVQIFTVPSLESIKNTIDDYLECIGSLDINRLRDAYEQRKNQSKGIATIDGNVDNLVQFTDNDGELGMKDTGYTIASALDAQLLVNPSQSLLMSLPRKLKHNINISITDGGTRYLSSFSGYTINIKGNGNWVMRDMNSGVDFISGTGRVYLWNCQLVHFRTGSDDIQSRYTCDYLHAHRSLVILNQGILKEVYLVGGSTLIDVPKTITNQSNIEKVMLIGHGCALYSWSAVIPIDPIQILGVAWWCNQKETVLYAAGRRIDEVSGEHDAELQPSDILEYDVNNIHIHLGGE